MVCAARDLEVDGCLKGLLTPQRFQWFDLSNMSVAPLAAGLVVVGESVGANAVER